MNEQDMRRFAELAQDFYAEKQQESGSLTPIKKAWASNEEGGLLIIVSCFGKHSRVLANQTGIPWKDEEPKGLENDFAELIENLKLQHEKRKHHGPFDACVAYSICMLANRLRARLGVEL